MHHHLASTWLECLRKMNESRWFWGVGGETGSVRIDIFINSKNHLYIFYLPSKEKSQHSFLHKHLFLWCKKQSTSKIFDNTVKKKKQVEQTREIKANLIEWLGWFPFIIFRTKGKQESREKEKRENENVFPIRKEKEIARGLLLSFSSQIWFIHPLLPHLRRVWYYSAVKNVRFHSLWQSAQRGEQKEEKNKEIEDFSDFFRIKILNI